MVEVRDNDFHGWRYSQAIYLSKLAFTTSFECIKPFQSLLSSSLAPLPSGRNTSRSEILDIGPSSSNQGEPCLEVVLRSVRLRLGDDPVMESRAGRELFSDSEEEDSTWILGFLVRLDGVVGGDALRLVEGFGRLPTSSLSLSLSRFRR